MRKFIIILSLFALISCNKDVKELGEIPFYVQNNLPMTNLRVNGKMSKFLIDSGASRSVIDETLKSRLNFKSFNDGGYFEGIGGGRLSKQAYNIVSIYKDDTLDITYKSVDIKNLRKGLGIVGIIGGDYLVKNNLVIDYERRTLRKNL